MVNLKIKGISNSFLKLHKAYDDKLNDESQKIVGNLLKDLKQATPIDTGLARNSWSVKQQRKNFVIGNSVPYIQRLNAGYSTQAPSHFIERIAIRYGKPIGIIVAVKQD
jgi:hypothetical protein